MKIAVMGSGGMGGYYGGLLAAAGKDIAFIARGRHFEAIQKNGLLLRGETEEIKINPALISNSCKDVGEVDVVLFCVKLYDTEAAAEEIKLLIGPDTMVISVLNGVD